MTMIDTSVLILFSALSLFAGMSWRTRIKRLETWRWAETATTIGVVGVVYVLPLYFLLPDSGNPGFETNKLWLVLLLNVLVLPSALAYVPRLVARVRGPNPRIS